jgi:hypothetical protein
MATTPSRFLPVYGLVSAVLVATGCAPVFSDFQSAKLVGPERVEVTPTASSVYASGKNSGHVQNEYGLEVGSGVLERLDLRARYVRVEGVNVFGFGPKVSLVKDKVAVSVPVGFAFGNDVDSAKSWAVHPTVLLTDTVNPHVELNATLKGLIPLSKGGGDTLVAVTVGAGFGNLERWVIRPELGFLFDPGQSGHFTHLGVGLTVFAGNRRRPHAQR